jgi:hypothetical protein
MCAGLFAGAAIYIRPRSRRSAFSLRSWRGHRAVGWGCSSGVCCALAFVVLLRCLAERG